MVMMTVISWNIRGLTARVKRSSLRKLITKYNPKFVFIQETKMETMSMKMLNTFWKLSEAEWAISPSRGNSGGILAIWNSSTFNMKSKVVEQNWIAITGVIPTLNFECTS